MNQEKKHKIKKFITLAASVTGVAYGIMSILARKKKKSSVYEDDSYETNPFEGKKVIFVESDTDKENADGVKGHLEAIEDSDYVPGFYDRYVKRWFDVVISFLGLLILSPVFAIVAIAIKVEDPGPVLFTQKRVGQNKKYFKLHKFRSMKMSTPHDVPTHMLDNPDQYITKIGKFIRAHSLDELPQIWDIFIGNMSIIGPRPCLWNQDVLVAERDKYGANDIKPGLTGWAQINGRDELEIPQKAKLDGEYVQKESLFFDIRCFLGTVSKVGRDDSVVEGGTGEMKKQKKIYKVGRDYTTGKTNAQLIGHIGFGETVEVDKNLHKKVLITGAGSYIGEYFKSYAEENYNSVEIETVDMLDPLWKEKDFSGYDIVYHVAGLAHADVGKVDDATKAKYYEVNTDLAVDVCNKAKAEGVKTFIFMSSMIVYGDSAPYGKKKVIDENTVPQPANFYGDSKLQADVAVRELADDKFKVIVLRPPMIYGRGSKGNYPTLSKLAKKLPVFPDVDNERSMLYIDNLCEFLCQIMLVKSFKENAIVLIPQNPEWTKTSEMVKEIAEVCGKKIRLLKILRPAVWLGSKVPGKIGGLVNKAFGNNCYDTQVSKYDISYLSISLTNSIYRTETKKRIKFEKPKAMILASVASMIQQFNMNNIDLLIENGFDVDVVCNCKEGNTISDEKIQDMIDELRKKNVTVYHVPIPRKISDIKGIKKSIFEVKHLCKINRYDLLHCHSPIGSVVARIAAKGRVKKVIYTAHGFHFYKGAPIINWMIFFPIEYIFSFITDVLITINKEDFEFAQKHMHAKKVEYVPGIGIETEKYVLNKFDKKRKRKELGLDDEKIMILSVGELNDNKNHEIIIKALAELNSDKLHYFIAGIGQKKEYLEKLAQSLNVNLSLLGYRSDVAELLNCADIYAFPSKREGLSVALMEAMSAGLPVVASNIRGNTDLVDIKYSGFLCQSDSVEEFCEAIDHLIHFSMEKKEMIKEHNKTKMSNFDCAIVMDKMRLIYVGFKN